VGQSKRINVQFGIRENSCALSIIVERMVQKRYEEQSGPRCSLVLMVCEIHGGQESEAN
jgi:hypothetical protein